MPLFGNAGERIAYEIHEGPSGAPPLLLLHGFTASSASFQANIAGLAARFRVIAVELLGHGRSDAPEDPGLYAPGPAMERIAGLLDHLAIERVLICGHSLGGALALRFALDLPDRVAGLVVINSNSAAGTPEWREQARGSMTAMAAKARSDGTAFLRQTRLYPGNGTRLPRDVRRRLTEDFDRLTPAGFAGTAEALVIDVNAFERLGSLQSPTLVVIGDRDADFVRNAPRFLVRLPHELVDTLTIAGAGHAANLEQAEVFNNALIAFGERIGYLPTPAGTSTQPADDVTAMPLPGAPGAERADGGDPDAGFGPTLYTEALAALRVSGRRAILAISGVGLILAGAVMVLLAFTAGEDGEGNVIAGAEPQPTPTPTAVEQAAGIRTAAPATMTPTPTDPVPAAAIIAVTATAAAPTPAPPPPTPVRTPTPAPTEEPTAAPTPAPSPTPTPSPTPSGPSVSITGPATGAPGEALTFSVSETPQALTRSWSASNGAAAAHAVSFTVSFATAGCHSVSVTTIFPGGLTRSASRAVAIGGAACG